MAARANKLKVIKEVTSDTGTSRKSGYKSSLMDRVVAKHRQQMCQARVEVEKFLSANGFKSGEVNGKMKSFFRTTTPLHEAVKQKKGSIVAALLQLGADSDSKDFPLGRTAFQYAEWSSAKEELTAIFRKCGCAPDSLQFCQTGSLLEVTPAPRGFEAFFAELQKDPLVHCRAKTAKIAGASTSNLHRKDIF